MRNILVILAALAFTSCKETVFTGFLDKPVIESYLYAGESPVVKVSKLIPFASDTEFSEMDVDKLSVTITETATQKKFSLTSKGDGTYGNEALVPEAGKSYQLSIPYNGMEVTATTMVPDKPLNVKLSATTITIPAQGEPGTGGGAEMPDPVELDWSNPGQEYYLVYVKNVESEKIPINSRNPGGNDFFRNQPTTSDHYELNARSFRYYGLHRVVLYKIQPEYVLFFQQSSNNSQSISEIKANVENGMGIFTGVNSVSSYIYVGTP